MPAGKPTNFFKFPRATSLRDSNRIAIFEALFIGIVAGASAFVLAMGVDLLGKARIDAATQYPAIYVLPAIGFFGGLITGLLVQYFAPDAQGSGIPQVKASLQRVRMPLDMKMAAIKLLGGIIALGSGLLMGREGPTVHVGASLAGHLNRLVPTTPERRRQLIAAGAGAGLAAAFNAPIAGVLFVLEELLKDISSSTIGTAVLACFVASVVSHELHAADAVSHVREVALHTNFQVTDIPFYLLLAVLAGLAGALFNRCIILCLDFNKYALRFLPLFMKIALAGAISGLIVAFLPTDFHNYAGVRDMIVVGHVDVHNALLVFGAFFAMTIIAYGSGAPGGLFAPSLLLGSALGYCVAILQTHLTGHASVETLTLAGMGAMFASVARVPVTAIVILFEMTQNFGVVLPLMFVCIIATMLANRLYPDSIYDRLMEWSGIKPKLTPTTKNAISNLKAENVMNAAAKTVAPDMTLTAAIKQMSEQQVEAAAVVSDQRLTGVVTALDLEAAISTGQSAAAVRTIQSDDPIYVSPHDSLENLLFLFDTYKLIGLPVVDGDAYKGMISRTDVIHALFVETTETSVLLDNAAPKDNPN